MATESGSGTPFPQFGSNRELGEILLELAEHVGMGEDEDAKMRALRSLQRAVKNYNTVQWVFNQTFQDITFLADTSEYDLDGAFGFPMRAVILDSDGLETYEIEFFTLKKKLDAITTEQGVGSLPDSYFMFNLHKRGKVKFHPRLSAGPFTSFPKCRIYFFTRTEIPTVTTGKLNVPDDVEEGIVSLALAHFMRKEKGAREARDDFILANALRDELEATHRDFADYARAVGSRRFS